MSSSNSETIYALATAVLYPEAVREVVQVSANVNVQYLKAVHFQATGRLKKSMECKANVRRTLERFHQVLRAGGDSEGTVSEMCLQLAAFNKGYGIWAHRPDLHLVCGSLGLGKPGEGPPWFEFGGHDKVFMEEGDNEGSSFCMWSRDEHDLAKMGTIDFHVWLEDGQGCVYHVLPVLDLVLVGRFRGRTVTIQPELVRLPSSCLPHTKGGSDNDMLVVLNGVCKDALQSEYGLRYVPASDAIQLELFNVCKTMFQIDRHGHNVHLNDVLSYSRFR